MDFAKLKRKLHYWLILPYLMVKKIWQKRRYRALILSRVKGLALAKSSGNLTTNIFISAAFRINSDIRQNILAVSAAATLNSLSGSGLKVKISDASPEQYTASNKEIFSKINGLRVEYQASPLKLPPAVSSLLTATPEKYFLMFFDDQPIVGLTREFLDASCRLLSDFEGLVDLIYISDAPKQVINHGNKTLTYDMADLDFRAKKVSPIATVSYGGYNFAIIPNAQIGFFFNTLIAPAADYNRRLRWYMDHVSAANSSLIEIAGGEFRGPAYGFIAVPLTVFQINIDYSHTENSVRNYSGAVPEEVCEALKNNYQVIVKE